MELARRWRVDAQKDNHLFAPLAIWAVWRGGLGATGRPEVMVPSVREG